MSLLSNRKEITVSTDVGEDFRVRADVFGDFAAHQRITNRGATGPGWVVTHIPTGLSVWRVSTEKEALRVAAWLEAHKPDVIPKSRNFDVKKWRSENAARIDTLRSDLEDLAPYWDYKLKT